MNFSTELDKVIILYRELNFLREERKRIVFLNNHFYEKIMRRCSELMGIPMSEMNLAIACEIRDGIDIDTYRKELRQRSKYFIIPYTGSARTLMAGEDAKKVYMAVHDAFVNTDEEIKGNIASKGKAGGMVKIVLGKSDFKKFRKGEILVAPMTRPEFVPLMKKAAAIVTDEGGITSHAAIISRELKKPCIIGTKTATKVLKDGDIVEVDADKGIVRKI